MADYTLDSQENVQITLLSPLKERVTLISFQGKEALSQPFSIEFEICSLENNLAFQDMLGQNVTLKILSDQGIRYLNGIITSFQQGPTYAPGTAGEHTFYQATLAPAFWVMTLNRTSRIFQELSYLEIVTTILNEYKIPFDNRVQFAGQDKFDFTVQFNESDFDFVSRLLEASGIFYFFEHAEDSHHLILGDGPTSFSAVPASEYLFLTWEEDGVSQSGVTQCSLMQQVLTSGVAVKDFNFQTPSTNLFAQTQGTNLGKPQYFYPGHYADAGQPAGEAISKQWLEAIEATALTLKGESTIPLFISGFCFSFVNHPRLDLNKVIFVLQEVYHDARVFPEQDPLTSTQRSYKNTFIAFERAVPYRPPRRTPWPKLSPQTALVTGKEAEEIWTDAHGRVKVKFHWDLSDTANDQTSCWIRVMQPWTGKSWGILFTPRIGQEVVISFLNGNPDQPLITGCVYNSENPPPYLPDSPTISTIKTNSSKGGDGFNELRFDDKKGNEQIYVHAQFNMDTEIEHNETRLIKAGTRQITVKGGDETHTNEQNYIRKIQQNYTRNVDGNHTDTVKGNYTRTITGNYTQKVQGNYELDVQGNYTCNITGNCTIMVTGAIQIQTTQQMTITAATGLTMISNTTAVLQGASLVTINSNGTMAIKASAALAVNGGGACDIKAGIVSINS